jgi:hypothetical protein
LKLFEGIWLVYQEKDPKFPTKVINKSQKISLVTVRDKRNWFTYVRMEKLKWLWCSPHVFSWKWVSMLFAQYIVFA